MKNHPNFIFEFNSAIDEFHKNTCVNFRERIHTDRHFIKISNGEGCWSYVGMQPELSIQGQEVSLGRECWRKGIIIHELMHVLGFYHEHSRYDRDAYIALNIANIQPNRIRQFDRRPREKVDDTGSYDLYSIMHYEKNAFAMNKKVPTIIPRFSTEKLEEMGQRKNLSTVDIQKINEYYNCTSSHKRFRPLSRLGWAHKNVETMEDLENSSSSRNILMLPNEHNMDHLRHLPFARNFHKFSNKHGLNTFSQNGYPMTNTLYGSNSGYSNSAYGPQTIHSSHPYGPSSHVYPQNSLQTGFNSYQNFRNPNNLILPQTFGSMPRVPHDIPPSIQCLSLEEANCMDRMDNCYEMAVHGFCEKKPGIMLKMCRRSCCNCNDKKCFDTKDSQKFNTLCIAETQQGNSLTKLNACEVQATRQNAMDYCPLTCGTCYASH